MTDVVKRVRDWVEVLASAEALVPIEKAVTRIVHPLLEEIERLRSAGGMWYTLTEAQLMSGWSASWFEEPVKQHDGKRRIDVWQERGMARRARTGKERPDEGPRGPWLLSEAAVAEARAERGAQAAAPPTTPAVEPVTERPEDGESRDRPTHFSRIRGAPRAYRAARNR
jgi:hypothetical protein